MKRRSKKNSIGTTAKPRSFMDSLTDDTISSSTISKKKKRSAKTKSVSIKSKTSLKKKALQRRRSKKSSSQKSRKPTATYIRARIYGTCPICKNELGWEFGTYTYSGATMECIVCRSTFEFDKHQTRDILKHLTDKLREEIPQATTKRSKGEKWKK